MISLKNVSMTYDGKITALHDITHTFDQHFTCLIGENGSGKSSLLSSIVGLHDYQGSIEVEGTLVNKKTLSQIRNQVGFLFQNPDYQLFMNTVEEDLMFGVLNQGFSKQEALKRVEEVAQTLKISHLLKRSPMKLSGGQKSLCALASVLVMSPKYLLLDEPTAFLDPKSRRRIINILKSLPQNVIMATHDLDMAYELADEIVLIEKGEIIASGNIDLLKDKTLLESHGLELPLRFQGE